ncbi:MAG: hypothetical protein HKM93_16285 [Desulfobacteraceae bacterium]|nr:hypothetical protein [Desulfobacteraceae bacterium]
MAKIKKRKLSWQASQSSQVVGYKLYWSDNGAVNYESKAELIGNRTELILPDDVKSFEPADAPIEIGVTAVDEVGNESDMLTMKAPFQFRAPEAPMALKLDSLRDNADEVAAKKSKAAVVVGKSGNIDFINPDNLDKILWSN